MKSILVIKEELSEGWKIVKFKDIFEIRKGKKVNISENPTENSIPYIVIENLRGEPIKKVSDDKKGLLCCSDDILIVWDGANCGTVGSGLDGFVGSTIARLSLIDDSIDKDYVLIFLKSRFKLFNTYTTGATIPHLDKNFLINFKIPVPPLETQKKIVEILEKAEELKEWRAEADELADELFNSFFLEMFGDPITNEKEFKTDLLKNLCHLKSGGTPSRKNKEYFEGDVPWITTVALGPKFIDSKDAAEYITEYAIEKSATKLIPKDSIMVGVRVGVGKASINRCEMCTNQDIMSLVNIDKKLNKDFLLQILRYYQKFFESQVRGATIKGITSSTLKELNIILPPIELQNQFAEIVKQVETLKKHQKQSKQEIDNLFNALMQKAFKGELTC